MEKRRIRGKTNDKVKIRERLRSIEKLFNDQLRILQQILKKEGPLKKGANGKEYFPSEMFETIGKFQKEDEEEKSEEKASDDNSVNLEIDEDDRALSLPEESESLNKRLIKSMHFYQKKKEKP